MAYRSFYGLHISKFLDNIYEENSIQMQELLKQLTIRISMQLGCKTFRSLFAHCMRPSKRFRPQKCCASVRFAAWLSYEDYTAATQGHWSTCESGMMISTQKRRNKISTLSNSDDQHKKFLPLTGPSMKSSHMITILRHKFDPEKSEDIFIQEN